MEPSGSCRTPGLPKSFPALIAPSAPDVALSPSFGGRDRAPSVAPRGSWVPGSSQAAVGRVLEVVPGRHPSARASDPSQHPLFHQHETHRRPLRPERSHCLKASVDRPCLKREKKQNVATRGSRFCPRYQFTLRLVAAFNTADTHWAPGGWGRSRPGDLLPAGGLARAACGESAPLGTGPYNQETALHSPSARPQMPGTLAFSCLPRWTGSDKLVPAEIEMANKASGFSPGAFHFRDKGGSSDWWNSGPQGAG